MSDPRDIPLEPKKCALLVIDMQKYCAEPNYGLNEKEHPSNISEEDKYMMNRISKTVVPSIQNILKEARAKKMEIIYTFIEALTKDGRDQSLDYKLSNFLVPKGSVGAKIIDPIAPQDDEILIPKTSCSVFISTNINYVLRNLGVTQVVMVGMKTNQCVESAVRDAADMGYLVTVVEDGCVTHSQLDHDHGLKNMKGFARICDHHKIINELEKWT